MPEPVQPTPPLAPPVLEATSAIEAQLSKLFPDGKLPPIPQRRAEEPIAPVTPPIAPPTAPIAPPVALVAPITPPSEDPVKAAADKAAADKAAADKVAADKAAADKTEADRIAAEKIAAPKKGLTETEKDAAEKTMTPQAGTAFKLVRAAEKEAVKRAEAAEARAKDLETKIAAVDPKEVEEIRQKLSRYETALSIKDVEATDEFQRDIAVPLSKAEATLTSLAAKYEISPATLQVALSEPDAAKRSDLLSELSANFNRLEIGKFDRAVESIQELQEKKTEALSTAQAQMADVLKRQREADHEALVRFEQSWKTALDTSFDKLVAEVPVVGATGDEKWDTRVKEAAKTVRGLDMGSLPNEQLAGALYKAEILPLVLGLVASLHDSNKVLNERVEKLSGNTPAAGGGAPPPIESPGPTITETTTFADIARQRLGNILPP